MKCPNCTSEELASSVEDFTISHRALNSVTVKNASFLRCENCGEQLIDDLLEEAVAAAYAQEMQRRLASGAAELQKIGISLRPVERLMGLNVGELAKLHEKLPNEGEIKGKFLSVASMALFGVLANSRPTELLHEYRSYLVENRGPMRTGRASMECDATLQFFAPLETVPAATTALKSEDEPVSSNANLTFQKTGLHFTQSERKNA